MIQPQNSTKMVVRLGLLVLLILSFKPAAESASFALAAQKNAVLQKDLPWSFGGRTQRGWYLYAPLIQHTIHTEAKLDSQDFAAAVSNWQKQNGLSADGILNHATWMKMVSVYQSERLGGTNRAQVFTGLELVSSSHFFDSARPIRFTQSRTGNAFLISQDGCSSKK